MTHVAWLQITLSEMIVFISSGGASGSFHLSSSSLASGSSCNLSSSMMPGSCSKPAPDLLGSNPEPGSMGSISSTGSLGSNDDIPICKKTTHANVLANILYMYIYLYYLIVLSPMAIYLENL